VQRAGPQVKISATGYRPDALLALFRRGHKLLGRQSNVAGNLSQQYRRNVSPLVKGHRRSTSVSMAELLVSAALPDFDEPQGFQARHHFLRLQHWQLGHG
jgi:hypothetical protein